MNFARSFTRLAFLAMIAGIALPQSASAQNNPLAGTWKFLPDKSAAMPGPTRYQTATITIPPAGDPIMTIEGTDSQGKPVKGTFPAVADC